MIALNATRITTGATRSQAFGLGVLLSFIPVLLYQGSITFAAMFLGDIASDSVINELTAVGGLLILSLGFNMLEMVNLKTGNLLPSLLFAVLISLFF